MPRLCRRSAHLLSTGLPDHLRVIAVFVVGLASWVAPVFGDPPPGPGDSVLATVGEVAITTADLRQEMARRGGSRPEAYATAEARRLLLDELVQGRLRVEAARAAGYHHDPEILRALELMIAAKLEREQLEPQFAELEVSGEEIAAHYRSASELYTTPEQVRVALVRLDLPVTLSEDAAEGTRAEVDAAQAARTMVIPRPRRTRVFLEPKECCRPALPKAPVT